MARKREKKHWLSYCETMDTNSDYVGVGIKHESVVLCAKWQPLIKITPSQARHIAKKLNQFADGIEKEIE